MGETMSDRAGFSGGAGDTAIIKITDTGEGLVWDVEINHLKAGRVSESAIEAAVDCVFLAMDRPDWREGMKPKSTP
jgi:hypothetical protein